jgi:uncharacterized membrane protein
MEILSLMAVVTAFLLVALYFDKLPDEIPNHFNFKGEPDGYSGKKISWSLPVFGLMMYLFLSMVGLFVTRVTRPEERKPEAMQQVSFMIAQLKLILVLITLYLVISTVRIALHHADGLSVLFLPVFLLSLALVIILNMIKVVRLQNKK